MNDFQSLNQSQRDAVLATEGYVRVIAGAGSGKTKLLVSRYAYLVTDVGIDTANILCVTFTNKAAGEMKKRIRALIGQAYDTGLICTYHGFCARLLREDAGRLFLDRGFQILDTAGQKSILEDIYRQMELKLDYASFESILKKIGLFKSDIAYVAAMTSPTPCPILPQIENTDHKIIEAFLQRQKALCALDFHDLISYALYLLETHPAVRQKWQERLNYIMVDEFQDSSRREMRLVDLLSEGYGNVMIVGDPDQNIYEWRGSDVRLLVDFDKTHLPTQTIFLNRNYRSTPQILACANTLIEKNQIRIKKNLYTLADAGAPVLHYHAESDVTEAKWMADTIQRLHKQDGCPYANMAVLYRSGFLSRMVEKQLTEAHIPYDIFGGVRFWRRMEVQDMVAYLKLIQNGDDESFRRIINVPRRKMGRGKMNALEDMRERSISMFDEVGDGTAASLLDTLITHAGDPVFRGSGAADFVSLMQAWREASDHMRVSELVRAVCEQSGYQQYIRELGDEERLENLTEFQRVADEFEKNFGEDLTLSAFLVQVALQAGEGDDSHRDAVKLMTIHASKGLEFPVVFVMGFTEGIFPSAKTIEERKQAGLEEERRLCYVALTRAREQLFLLDSEGFSENGVKKLPSRFLREIGEENYTRMGHISDELIKESQTYVARSVQGMADHGDKAVGEDIQHHIFGHGVILAKDEKRGSYIIKFDKMDKPRHIARTYFDTPHEMPPAQALEPMQEVPRPDADTLPSSPPADREPAHEKNIPEVRQEEASDAIPAVTSDVMPADGPKAEVETVADTEPEAETAIEAADMHMPVDDPVVQVEPIPDAELPPSTASPTSSDSPPDDGLTDTQRQELKARLAEAENLWKRPDVPHTGWTCTGVTDLGAPVGVCAMCGTQIIRYVHHMVHPEYPPLGVGCVCAGKMEGNVQAARQRERDFKNRQTRLARFMERKWKLSKNGNQYIKIKDRVFLLYQVKGKDVWRYSVDKVFRPTSYPTREEALRAIFDEI